jgi:hypothetical protein
VIILGGARNDFNMGLLQVGRHPTHGEKYKLDMIASHNTPVARRELPHLSTMDSEGKKSREGFMDRRVICPSSHSL